MQHLDRLKGFYNFIELRLDACPALFSAALPSARAIAEWPAFPRAAMPQSGRVANGRGLSKAASFASCLGEAAELASCCAWGDESLLYASTADLGPQAIAPKRTLGLTNQQVTSRSEWNALFGALDWRPNPCAGDTVIAWMKVADAYSGEEHYAPADAILIGRRETGDEEAVAVGDSNGCACGEDVEDAKLAAILELVERDALARWWYGRRGRRTVRLSPLTGHRALDAYLETRSRRSILFDITTDIGIPAFAAVSSEPDGSDVVIGSAAGVDATSAASSALTEMLQVELNLASEAGASSEIWGRWRRDVSMRVEPLSLHGEEGEFPEGRARLLTPADMLRQCLAACSAAGISLFFADMTRPELGVPVVRAISTDLCHFKPRFGRRRLLADDSRDLTRTAEAGRVPNPVILLI